jgi:hypothetical protein
MSTTNNNDDNISNDSSEFTFKFTESGGPTGRYLMVSFDSKTNTLTSATDISGSNLSHKPIPDSEKQELREEITNSNFFSFKLDYPPEKEDPSLVGYNLSVTIGDRTHTTTWTNDSKEIPKGLNMIVNAIRRITAKEKVV